MVGLRDIAPLKKSVPFRDGTQDVHGITAEGLVSLIDRFPEIRKIMADRSSDLEAGDIMKMLPRAIAAIISAGLGVPGDAETEKNVANLTAGEQLDFVSEIVSLTFPRGFGPFVEHLRRLGLIERSDSADTGKVQVTKSASPSEKLSKTDILQK